MNLPGSILNWKGKDTSFEELERLGAGRLKLAVKDGDIATGSVMAGQIAGLIDDIKNLQGNN